VELVDGLGQLLSILDQVPPRGGLCQVRRDVLAQVPDPLGHLMGQVVHVGRDDSLSGPDTGQGQGQAQRPDCLQSHRMVSVEGNDRFTGWDASRAARAAYRRCPLKGGHGLSARHDVRASDVDRHGRGVARSFSAPRRPDIRALRRSNAALVFFTSATTRSS
jgi:hypothetical protein